MGQAQNSCKAKIPANPESVSCEIPKARKQEEVHLVYDQLEAVGIAILKTGKMGSRSGIGLTRNSGRIRTGSAPLSSCPEYGRARARSQRPLNIRRLPKLVGCAIGDYARAGRSSSRFARGPAGGCCPWPRIGLGSDTASTPLPIRATMH